MRFYLQHCDLYHVYSHYKSKRTIRWDRQSQGIENVHNKVTKSIVPPP